MVRLILIGVGVVSTALAGYVAKRKLFGRSSEQVPVELKIYPTGSRPRTRRSRRPPFNEVLDNGRVEDDPA